MKDYHIGMVVTGKVTGIQPYGIFVSLEDDVQGLIHISEIKPEFVHHLSHLFHIGDEVTAKIIDIDEYNHKMSLSSRALYEHVPRRYLKKHYFTNKNKKIGFLSIKREMNKWIETAMDDLHQKNEERTS